MIHRYWLYGALGLIGIGYVLGSYMIACNYG